MKRSRKLIHLWENAMDKKANIEALNEKDVWYAYK